ncbi:MAG: HD domain-containing protein [Candidatus Nanoarchaeia archaeon]|jgi:5'-deoxynucleotidase YfbR-like HD superfamily hydrolase
MNHYYEKVLHSMKNTKRYESRIGCLHEALPCHCFSLIELAELYHSKYELNLDVNVAKNIAQNHDLGEYLKGDIDAGKIAHGKVSEKEKHEQELAAWAEIKKLVPEKLYEQKYAYWEMFEKLDTLEAKYVKSLDKLEAILYMCEIGAEGFINKEIDNACGMDEKDYDLTAKYMDEAFNNFLLAIKIKENPGDLNGFLGELKHVKEKLKLIYEKVKAPWKEEYNYGME